MKGVDHWYPKGTLSKPYLPVDIWANSYAPNVEQLMPPAEDIPDEFGNDSHIWVEFVREWFYSGLNKDLVLYPVETIDPDLAFKHVAHILSSWEPKHEYKMAACAYLMSLWFESVGKSYKRKSYKIYSTNDYPVGE